MQRETKLQQHPSSLQLNMAPGVHYILLNPAGADKDTSNVKGGNALARSNWLTDRPLFVPRTVFCSVFLGLRSARVRCQNVLNHRFVVASLVAQI